MNIYSLIGVITTMIPLGFIIGTVIVRGKHLLDQ